MFLLFSTCPVGAITQIPQIFLILSDSSDLIPSHQFNLLFGVRSCAVGAEEKTGKKNKNRKNIFICFYVFFYIFLSAACRNKAAIKEEVLSDSSVQSLSICLIYVICVITAKRYVSFPHAPLGRLPRLRRFF